MGITHHEENVKKYTTTKNSSQWRLLPRTQVFFFRCEATHQVLLCVNAAAAPTPHLQPNLLELEAQSVVVSPLAGH